MSVEGGPRVEEHDSHKVKVPAGPVGAYFRRLTSKRESKIKRV